jgi:hypothetical protein
MNSYLELYKRPGLQDPREFYLNCVIANISKCNKSEQAIYPWEYRRQTGRSTELAVQAIDYMVNPKGMYSRIWIFVPNITIAHRTRDRLTGMLEALGIPYDKAMAYSGNPSIISPSYSAGIFPRTIDYRSRCHINDMALFDGEI